MDTSSTKWRVNTRPRFTVLTLGEYMVADDSPRETMLRGMRYERLAPTLRYSHLYRAIPKFLASPTRDLAILEGCRQDVERARSAAKTPRARDNLTYELRALETFERSLNALPMAGWTLELAPLALPIKLNGVSISVQPSVHIRRRRHRGADQIGALLVDPAKGLPVKSEDGKAKARRGMAFSAMLLHQYVVGAFPADDPKATTEYCVIFHTHRQEAVQCPTNYKRFFAV